MRKTVLLFFVIVFAFSIMPVQAHPREFSGGNIDLRLGSLFSEFGSSSNGNFSIGLRGGGYVGEGALTRRLSINFSFDYLPLSKTEVNLPVYANTFFVPAGVRIERHGFMLGPSVGFDAVQISQLDVTAYLGFTAIADMTTFSLRNNRDEWENVCHLVAFSDSCPVSWSLLGNYGLGLRYFPRSDHPLYLGVDYRRLTNDKNHLVGTIGLSF